MRSSQPATITATMSTKHPQKTLKPLANSKFTMLNDGFQLVESSNKSAANKNNNNNKISMAAFSNKKKANQKAKIEATTTTTTTTTATATANKKKKTKKRRKKPPKAEATTTTTPTAIAVSKESKETLHSVLHKMTESSPDGGDDETTNNNNNRGSIYLSKQFQNLNTAASRKKHRCALCTRPVSDETPHALVCEKCA